MIAEVDDHLGRVIGYLKESGQYDDALIVFTPDHGEQLGDHQDGTGRLQTVKREWNEKYYLLLEELHRLTGVPLVLNTSFNVMGKPIIHTVEDAVAVFFSTGLDALVIEDYIVEKPSR